MALSKFKLFETHTFILSLYFTTEMSRKTCSLKFWNKFINPSMDIHKTGGHHIKLRFHPITFSYKTN